MVTIAPRLHESMDPAGAPADCPRLSALIAGSTAHVWADPGEPAGADEGTNGDDEEDEDEDDEDADDDDEDADDEDDDDLDDEDEDELEDGDEVDPDELKTATVL
jgi:hypothetical protein